MNQRSDNWTKNRRCFATVILPCENAKAGRTHSALHGHGYTVCHRRGRSNRSASVRLKLSSIQGEYSHCEGTLYALYAPPGVIYLGFLEAPPACWVWWHIAQPCRWRPETAGCCPASGANTACERAQAWPQPKSKANPGWSSFTPSPFIAQPLLSISSRQIMRKTLKINYLPGW